MKTKSKPTSFKQLVKSGEVTRVTKSGGFVSDSVCARIVEENKAGKGWKLSVNI